MRVRGVEHGRTLWRTFGGAPGGSAGGRRGVGGDAGAVNAVRRTIHTIDPASQATETSGGVHRWIDVRRGAEERRVDRLSSRPGTEGDAVLHGRIAVGTSAAGCGIGYAGGPRTGP